VPLCKAYRVTKVWGDNFAGEFAKEAFRKAGVFYDLWPQHKSEIYRDALLPLINSKLIKLPRTGVGARSAISLVYALKVAVCCRISASGRALPSI